jgi:uncharacterized protein (UPF0548 family)
VRSTNQLIELWRETDYLRNESHEWKYYLGGLKQHDLRHEEYIKVTEKEKEKVIFRQGISVVLNKQA